MAVTAHEWTVDDPKSESRSLISGRRYVSQALRRRRQVRLTVLGSRANSSGYMEALKRLLRGGVHLVRLRSRPLYVGQQIDGDTRSGEVLQWFSELDIMDWLTGNEGMLWLESGVLLTAAPTTVDGFPAVTISGFPTSTGQEPQLVGRVGEFITVYPSFDNNDGGVTAMLLRDLYVEEDGSAVAVTDTAIPFEGRADIGTGETAAFEPVRMPRALHSYGQSWFYDWEFSQVYEDEVEGGFVELNPWA